MESIASLKELYQEFIWDIYHAEVLLVPVLRFFSEKTNSQQLKRYYQESPLLYPSYTSGLEEIQENLKGKYVTGTLQEFNFIEKLS